MQTKAVRIHGKDDLRLETFELPEPREDEILAKVVSDSICMSSYKAAHQADTHKRVPRNIAEIPVIIGHEFAGEIITVGKKWQGQFKPGDKFSIQPAINYEGGPAGLYSAPGYSYPYAGGDATYIIIPNEVMEKGCLLIRIPAPMSIAWRSNRAARWPCWRVWVRWAWPPSTMPCIGTTAGLR